MVVSGHILPLVGQNLTEHKKHLSRAAVLYIIGRLVESRLVGQMRTRPRRAAHEMEQMWRGGAKSSLATREKIVILSGVEG